LIDSVPRAGCKLTLAELVDEYVETHEAEPTTIAKLRWLLCQGDRRAFRPSFSRSSSGTSIALRASSMCGGAFAYGRLKKPKTRRSLRGAATDDRAQCARPAARIN
jgi:hypothetical protein